MKVMIGLIVFFLLKVKFFLKKELKEIPLAQLREVLEYLPGYYLYIFVAHLMKL